MWCARETRRVRRPRPTTSSTCRTAAASTPRGRRPQPLCRCPARPRLAASVVSLASLAAGGAEARRCRCVRRPRRRSGRLRRPAAPTLSARLRGCWRSRGLCAERARPALHRTTPPTPALQRGAALEALGGARRSDRLFLQREKAAAASPRRPWAGPPAWGAAVGQAALRGGRRTTAPRWRGHSPATKSASCGASYRIG